MNTDNTFTREVYYRFLGDEFLAAGYHVGPPEMRTRARNVERSEYSLSYVIHGQGTFQDALNPPVPFRPGTLIQRFPGRRYSIHRLEGMPHVEFFLILPGSQYKSLLKTGVVRKRPAVLQVGEDPVLRDSMRTFVDNLKSGDGKNVNPLWLLDALQLVRTMFLRSAAGQHDPELAWLPQARDMLAASGPSDMSLDDVAQELGVGYETFRKTFRRETGMSPGEYRHRKRFEYAIELLLDRSATLQSVADTLGYGSVAAFVKQFTARIGMPPGRFREQHQNR